MLSSFCCRFDLLMVQFVCYYKKPKGKEAQKMLHILMGRARSGKSAYVLEQIRALGDASRQILLVPEHASHVAEVDMCTACGETASRHAEVLTFKLLASRVLSVCGGAADVTLDNGGKLLTLQRCLQELAPSLSVYHRPSQRAAFLESLLAVMEELQAYAVSPEIMLEKTENIGGESGDKLHDIALLYGVYLARLHTDERDARDRLQKLEENLEASRYIDGKDVFLDGFSYFTGRERNILRIMLSRANSVTVTLLGDSADADLFAESLLVRERLIALADEAGVPYDEKCLPPHAVQGALDHIERAFFYGRKTWDEPTDAVSLYEASGIYTECEYAAAQILRLVRESGCRFRDITVTARNLSTYSGTLETVFKRYGIPVYCARRSDILGKPVLALIVGALDAVSGGFEYEDVFRCLKTGLAGLKAEEVDILENYVLKWDIRGNMWTRETPWSAHPDGYGADWDEQSNARLAAVNEYRVRVCAPFAHLAAEIRGGSTAREKVKALYAYLEEIALPDTLQQQTEELFAAGDGQRAEETAQLWSILCGVMDQLVEILGDCELDGEEFARLFRLILTQYSVGTIPVALDAVNISEMTRNDRHTVKALFLLGANDGVLPSVEGKGGILREEDRMALEQQEIRLAPYGMAQFHLEMQNLYASLAQPTEKLFISYPVFDAKGTELRPSFLVGRICRLCPTVNVEKENADKEYRLSAIAPALEYAGEHIGGEAWQYFAEKGAYAAALAAMESASHYTRGKLSTSAVKALYGNAITLSASRMDKAKSCHFAYFMRYGLRAKERDTAGFDAPQIGTFIHDVMEHTLTWAKEAGGIRTLDKAALHQLVRRAIHEYISENLPDLTEKTARFRYLFRRLCDSAERIMDEVADELRNSDFVPLAFELAFGPNGQLPAITVTDGGNEACVVGQVDRVDGWLHDGKLYLRVVDYKTGKKTFDLAELRYGMGIQMLLYLFALKNEGEALFGYEIVPAGVLYTPAREPILKCARSTEPEKIAAAFQKELQRSGMVLNDPQVLEAMEHSALENPCYLPVAVKRNKDGTAQIIGSLADSEQLGKLGKYVDHLLREISREVFAGNIDADPCARSPKDSACTYCEFSAACHFENGTGGDHIEYIRKTKAEELWQHIDDTLSGKEAGGNAESADK